MKRITLTMGTVVAGLVLAAASGAVLAQDPTPPARPARPAPAVPAEPPAPAPRAVHPLLRDFEYVRPMEPMIAPMARMNADMVRAQAEFARETVEINRAQIAEARIDAERAREEMRSFELARPYLAQTPMPGFAPRAMSMFDSFDNARPPAPWAQGDPADSLYQRARNLINNGEWGTSARLFADIQKNYANSAYKTSAQYWEAYARYKIGTTDELEQAVKLLEPLASKITSGTNSGYTVDRKTRDNDISALWMRINGALAMRGNAPAAQRVAKAASTPGAACDDEEQKLKTEALSALSQLDPAQALPLLRKVLDRKDDCSASLRRDAVFIIGRRADNESAAILLGVAKNDPSTDVRSQAISFLARTPGDAGINALEDMLKNEQDERIQAAAVRALMSSDNQRARTGMRALIDRKDAPTRLRVEAINSFNAERATTEDIAYLRGLFAKADNDQIKNAIVNSVSRIGGAENDQWVMNVARNNNESSTVRSNAINRFMRTSNTIPIGDLIKLYDAASESSELRSRIINILGNRKEPEATDKLVDIVKNSTVISHRSLAIQALVNKKDPRATKLLEDILDGKKP